MNDLLRSARIGAAQASLGTSADPIYRAVLAALDAAEASGHILDFGAGTGSLARTLCASGRFSAVTAADIHDYTSGIEHPKLNWVFSDLNQELPDGRESYDAIVAAEVIEHLENPRFVAREWFRLLRPGGVLVLSTPNNESWRAILSLIFKKHFAAFTGPSYPAHLTALLRADLIRVLDEAGFERVGFSFTNSGALPKSRVLTWQKISLGQLKGLRHSDNLVCTARKPMDKS